MHEWQEYPQRLVSRYIRRQLEMQQEPGTPGFQAAHNTLSPCEPGVIRSLSQLNLTRQTSEQVNSSE